MVNKDFYYQMVLIRKFEEKLFDLFSAGELSGTIHTSIGQEAAAVGVISNLIKSDIVISNHRCHGHYLAKTKDVQGLLAEIMGKADGMCGGRGGSQHIYTDGFFSNGVLGNMFPVASGLAYAEKMKGSDSITVVFIGDGALGEGTIYETLNLISLWEIPILVVIENNMYAQSTPLNLNFSGSFLGRAEAFNIEAGEIKSNDVIELYKRFGTIVDKIRLSKKPHIEIIHTYRLGPHSKGDDDRNKEEIESWKKIDPLKLLEKKLKKTQIEKIQQEVIDLIDEAEIVCKSMKFPELDFV